MPRKIKRTYGIRRGSRKVGKRIDWFWEAYWTESGRDVSRRFSENAYGDGIAERKARECRRAAEDRLPKFEAKPAKCRLKPVPFQTPLDLPDDACQNLAKGRMAGYMSMRLVKPERPLQNRKFVTLC